MRIMSNCSSHFPLSLRNVSVQGLSGSLGTSRLCSLMIYLLNWSLRNGIKGLRVEHRPNCLNQFEPQGDVLLYAVNDQHDDEWCTFVHRTLYDSGPVLAMTLPCIQGGDWLLAKFLTMTGLSIAKAREWAWESWWLFCLLTATYNLSHIRTQLVKHRTRPSVHQHLCLGSTSCTVRCQSVLLLHGKLESLHSSLCQPICGWMVGCRSHMMNPIPTQEGTELCTCKCWAIVNPSTNHRKKLQITMIVIPNFSLVLQPL